MKYTDVQDKLPQWLHILVERIHEHVPYFSERVASVYREGLDFDSIRRSIMIYVLESTLDKFDHNQYPDVFNCVTRVIELYRTNEQDRGKWEVAQDAAEAAEAAYYAARAAAWATSNAAWTAWAAYYAAWAAWAAAWEPAADAARDAAYRSFGDKLIELMINKGELICQAR